MRRRREAVAVAAGGGRLDDTGRAKSVTGVFLDAAVEGLDYVAGTAAKASTNAKGEFVCKRRRDGALQHRRAGARQRRLRRGGHAAHAGRPAGTTAS